MDHGRPGAVPQTAKREQFAELVARGVPSAEACRTVGVNTRTGKRWRHGGTITSSSGRKLHYPAVISTRTRKISSRYLSEDERVRVADLHRQGLGVRAVKWAVDGLRHDDTTVPALARHLGVNWHTAWNAVKAEARKRIREPERIRGVTALGVDEHIWRPGMRGQNRRVDDHGRAHP